VLLPGWSGGPLRLARELKRRMIPLLRLEDYLVEVAGGYAFVDSRVRLDAEEWVRRVREERERQLDLERIVREYREMRARRGLPRRGV